MVKVRITGPGIVEVKSKDLIETPMAQRQINAAQRLSVLEAERDELRAELADAVSDYNRCVDDVHSLRDELAQCRKDAERWRKCKMMRREWWLMAMDEANRYGGIPIDESIDAAIAAEGEAHVCRGHQ